MAFDKPDEAFEFAQEHIRRDRQARWEPHEEEELVAALRRTAATLGGKTDWGRGLGRARASAYHLIKHSLSMPKLARAASR